MHKATVIAISVKITEFVPISLAAALKFEVGTSPIRIYPVSPFSVLTSE